MRYTALLLILAAASPAAAQSRAQEIAADFTKLKDVTKTKHGVSSRKFKEIVSEPWRVDLRSYTGRYESLGDDSYLDVRIGANGVVSVSGADEEAFEVRDARIQDALLRGTKVYRDGRSEALEAAFLKRSDRAQPGESFTVRHGIGVLVAAPAGSGVSGDLRVFLEKQ